MRKKVIVLLLLLSFAFLASGCDLGDIIDDYDIVEKTTTSSTAATSSDTTNTTSSSTTTNPASTTTTTITSSTTGELVMLSISEVVSRPVGSTYKTQGTVIGVTTKGYLLADSNAYIYVYLGVAPAVSAGNTVEVIGVTAEYGGAIQFSGSTTQTELISEGSVPDPGTPTAYEGEAITEYATNFQVGEYVQLTGMLSISGSYCNVSLEDTSVTGSLQTTLDLTAYVGKTVDVTGFVLYVSGSSSKYLNILATEVEESEVTVTPENATIETVVNGPDGVLYTTNGLVIGITTGGFVITDSGSFLYVYTANVESLNINDLVSVTGVSSTFNGVKELGQVTSIEKNGAGSYVTPEATVVSDATQAEAYIGDYHTGDYINVIGTLSVSGTYVNISINGTATILASPSTADDAIDLAAYDGQSVFAYGYVTYVSGSTNKYINFIVTSIGEHQEVESISSVISSNLGLHATRGTVIGITAKGYMISDDDLCIFVFLNALPTVAVGDYVEITGTTSTYGGAVQFGTDTTALVVSSGNNLSFMVTEELTGSELDTYAASFNVGDYVELTGTLSVSGTYYNLSIDGTDIIGSLNASAAIDVASYEGAIINARGYVMYVSQSGDTTYFNLLLTQIENAEITYSLIGDVLTGTVGDSYYTYGYVLGVGSTGFVLTYGGNDIYVHIGTTANLVMNDFVAIHASSSEYSNIIELSSVEYVTLMNNSGSNYLWNPLDINNGEAVENYVDVFETGDYVQLYGLLSISGNYINLVFDDTTAVKGSLQTADPDIDLTQYAGKYVTVNGIVTFVNGTTIKYLNIIVTEIGEYLPIDHILANGATDSATARGTIVGVARNGYMISDGSYSIYVYLGSVPDFEVGDHVQVTGPIVSYGGAFQFGSSSVTTKLSTKPFFVPDTLTLSGSAVTDYANNFSVGEYIELTGTLYMNGIYANLIIDGTAVVGSLNTIDESLSLAYYNEYEITVRGYVMYVSGSSTKYLNIIVKEIEEVSAPEYTAIGDVLTGTVGNEYTTRGTVVAVAPKGVIIGYGYDYIYVYIGSLPDVATNDYIEVTGTTSAYGGVIELGSLTSITKLTTKSFTVGTALDLCEGSNVTTYANAPSSGDYVKLAGTLTVSGDYYNITIDGTEIIGSLNTVDASLNLASYDGQAILVEGYVMYVSGTTTKYLNIVVVTVEDYGFTLLGDVLAGSLETVYTTRGTVIAVASKGFILEYNEYHVYVYLGETPSVVPGDYIEITGTLSTYGDDFEIKTVTSLVKISEENFFAGNTIDLSEGSDVTTYISVHQTGDYVLMQGTLSISGSYYNLTIDGTTVIGSLNTIDETLNLSSYSGQAICVEGYVMYVSGSTTKYLNIVVSNVEAADPGEVFDLTVLTVNDLHGYIEQEEDGTGGISNMAYLIDQIRNANALDDVVLIANGDMFQGTAISNMTQGLSVLDCMNAMDFDAMGIGNHEFDWDLDTIMAYFDGNAANGEADFPLLNANIYLVADNSLLTIAGGNMFVYTIVEREGVEIAIISYIGDVYNSIAFNLTEDYYFDLDIADSVDTIANQLDDAGVDIIIVNIHDGDSSGITNYSVNSELAAITNENGEYLIDIVINGHTHSRQTGTIARSNAEPLLLIQAGSNGNYFGKIVLEFDTATEEITGYTIEIVNVETAGENYDAEVEAIVDAYAASVGNEVLATAGETITDKAQLQQWTASVMLAATGADIAISNDGGIRSTGNIVAGEDVTVAQLYEISPFDNVIYVMEVSYSDIESLLNNSALYYGLADGVVLEEGQTYTLAVISYVYGWNQLDNVRSDADIDTGLYIRDLQIEDISIKGDAGISFSPISNPEASISLQQ